MDAKMKTTAGGADMSAADVIKHFKIIKKIGTGGMGDVFLALDTANSGRPVAIKTIKSRIIEKNYSLNQFRHEYDVMSRLWHPNLARVYDFGELPAGGLYLVMEYVEGAELAELLQSPAQLNQTECCSIMVELLRAMEFIHSRNIVYCDIKPQNILFDAERKLKLIDFGLSDFRDRSGSTIKGTIAYMAPETMNGNGADFRSDIFSLGILFYQLLTKKIIHKDNSINSIIKSFSSHNTYHSVVIPVFEELENPGLREIIRTMCAYDPGERYASCAEIIMAINEIVHTAFPIETEETREAYITGVSFTGRNKELNHLTSFMNSSENRLLLVTGNPGTGKSRLLNEFQKKCKLEGAVYLQGSSLKGETLEPFLPVVSEILYAASGNLDSDKKSYLARLLPDHPLLAGSATGQPAELDAKTQKGLLLTTLSSLIIDYAAATAKKVVIALNRMADIDEISLELLNEILYRIQLTGLTNLRIVVESRSDQPQEVTRFFIGLKEKNRLAVLKLADFQEIEVAAYISNTFGAGNLDISLTQKIPDIYKYSGGNPLFLQELLISMVTERIITRESSCWKFSGSVGEVKISRDLKSIIKKRIATLKLTDSTRRGLQLLSFTRQEVLTPDFFIRTFKSLPELDWQKLFDLLVRKEFLFFKDGEYRVQNQLFLEVLQSNLSVLEKSACYRLWANGLYGELPANHDLTAIDDRRITDLAYYLDKSVEADPVGLLPRTVEFLFEAAKREKERYANRQAVYYFTRLLKLLDEYDKANKHTELVIQASTSLAAVYELTGRWEEAVSLYRQAVNLTSAQTSEELAAGCRCYLATLLRKQGQFTEALQLLQEAAKIAEKLPDQQQLADVYGSFGNLHFNRSEYKKAKEFYNRQRKISESIGYTTGLCTAVGNTGNIYMDQGNYRKALKCCRLQLKYNEQTKNKHTVIVAVNNIGNIYLYLNKYAEALKYYKKSQSLCEEIGDKSGTSKVLGNMGIAYKFRKNFEKALSCYRQALDIKYEMGDKEGISRILGNMGIIYGDTGNYSGALECYNQALALKIELGDKMGGSTVTGNIGNIYMDQGDFKQAAEYYSQALCVKQELGDKLGASIMLYNLGLISAEQHNSIEALKYYNQAVEVGRELGSKSFLCEFLISRAETLHDLQDNDGAVQSINEVLKLTSEEEDPETVIKSTFLAHKFRGDTESMTALLQTGTSQSLELLSYLNYELWLATKNPEYRLKASELYSRLYAKSPRYEYKKRILD